MPYSSHYHHHQHQHSSDCDDEDEYGYEDDDRYDHRSSAQAKLLRMKDTSGSTAFLTRNVEKGSSSSSSPNMMVYKTTGRCLRPFYVMCLSRTILVIGFLFVVWQSYKNCKAQEELCKMTRDSLEAIRLASVAFNTIKEPVHMPTPSSAKICDAITEYNELGKPIDTPTIYAITPTFTRPVQKAELTRLSQTFLLVPNFHWIVVEDSPQKTPLVVELLASSGLTYTHINAPTPPQYKLHKNDPNWKKPRGVEQRNAALRWIRNNLNESHNGVIYFADDDNTYSRFLFKEIAKVKRVGVWPVGLVGGLMVERPVCDKATKQVTGFNAVWKPDRPFPIDMAGFGINLKVILEKKEAYFAYDIQSGFQESEILKKVTRRDELEGLADGCTKVYVWHTRTAPPVLNTEQILNKKGKSSNIGIEV